MRRLGLLLALIGFALPACASAKPAAKLKLVKVGRFTEPVYATSPPGDKHRLFVVSKSGLITEVRSGKVLAKPFLDIRSLVLDNNEQGLLSLAFAPDYAHSHLFYVFYTDKDAKERVVEYHASGPNRANPASARSLLILDDPEENNNGGQLQFGPDGNLYIGNGDGGGEEVGPGDPHGTIGNGQDLGSLFGKILRIDPTGTAPGEYKIPPTNPFQATGQAPEIYMYGLRNPWRFSFDAKTGAMIVPDVGRGAEEEINWFRRGKGIGANLGWRVWEGTVRDRPDETAADAVFPQLEFNHTSDNFCAMVGGYVSRDPKVPALYGRFLFTDLCHGQIYAAKLRTTGSTFRKTSLSAQTIVSFGQDGRLRQYVVTESGPVYRIAAG